MTALELRDVAEDRSAWSSVRVAPRMWGLKVETLVEAWWRSQGVAWIRRGQGEPDTSGADLYLLTEPGQMVAFDLGELVSSLTWNQPSVSRVRIVTADEEEYRERLVTGEAGAIIGVRREYRSQGRGSRRVLLTPSATLARRWGIAADRRSAWIEVRRTGSWSRSDHHRLRGEFFQTGDPSQEGSMLTCLIERWSDPQRVIPSLREVRRGVIVEGEWTPGASDVLIGPSWIGRRGVEDDPLCVVGPAWIADRSLPDPASPAPPAEVLPLEEIPTRRPERERGGQGGDFSDVFKRAIDVLVSATVLIVLSPLLLLIAIAVVVDDGWPIVFGHERQTRGGGIFRCLKFRTMRRNAEAMAEKLRASNVCDGPQVFIENDPRVTRVGRWLRRFHLDELLQFVNVLRGEMSLVGPRPSPERENRLCPAWRDARLSVRPGITGLWQVCRTRQPGLDFQEWIRFDLHYVSHRSLRLDAWIVVQTVRGLVFKESAHAPEPPRQA